MVPNSLAPEIRALAVEDRIKLADQIWESVVEDEASFQLTAAQQAELLRRIAAHEADPTQGKSWEKVKQRLLGE